MLGTSGLVLLLLFAAVVVAIVVLVILALRAVVKRGSASAVSVGQFHVLAGEHRRMSELAMTASENVDLRLADLSARIDELRGQVQRILTDVE
jgi:hypothetical protein